MSDNLLNPAELKFLWKQRGNPDYDLQNFISNGLFIQFIVFKDVRNHQKVLGKIVTAAREGEAYHWPRLQHENLAPLIDIVSINETISIYISPFIGRSLRDVIHDGIFMSDFKCFDRKRAYAEDILWALDYLHEKSLCLMNLTDAIIKICDSSDKAVICEFSSVVLVERATKDEMKVPVLYHAPEIKRNEEFDPIAAEMWTCGVMMLHIFTRHFLPSAFIGDEVNQVLNAVTEINHGTLKETNPGAKLGYLDVDGLREFLYLFLTVNPKCRVTAKSAAVSPFLTGSRFKPKIKDGFYHSQYLHYNANFGYPWPSYQISTKKACRGREKSSMTFEDIYLREVAKCREKLKKLPCTNKFINLNFIPNGDNVSKPLNREANRNNGLMVSNYTDLKTETDSMQQKEINNSRYASEEFNTSDNKTSDAVLDNSEKYSMLNKGADLMNSKGKLNATGDVITENKTNNHDIATLSNLAYRKIPGDWNEKCGDDVDVKGSASESEIEALLHSSDSPNTTQNDIHIEQPFLSKSCSSDTLSLNYCKQTSLENQLNCTMWNTKLQNPKACDTDMVQLKLKTPPLNMKQTSRVSSQSDPCIINSITSEENSSFNSCTSTLLSPHFSAKSTSTEAIILDTSQVHHKLDTSFADCEWNSYETVKPQKQESFIDVVSKMKGISSQVKCTESQISNVYNIETCNMDENDNIWNRQQDLANNQNINSGMETETKNPVFDENVQTAGSTESIQSGTNDVNKQSESELCRHNSYKAATSEEMREMEISDTDGTMEISNVMQTSRKITLKKNSISSHHIFNFLRKKRAKTSNNDTKKECVFPNKSSLKCKRGIINFQRHAPADSMNISLISSINIDSTSTEQGNSESKKKMKRKWFQILCPGGRVN